MKKIIAWGGVLFSIICMPLPIADLILGSNRAPDGQPPQKIANSTTCHRFPNLTRCQYCKENYRRALIVRGALFLGLSVFFGSSSFLVVTENENLMQVVTVPSLLVILLCCACIGWGIYIFVIIYEQTGLDCIATDRTIWKYTGIVQWIYFIQLPIVGTKTFYISKPVSE